MKRNLIAAAAAVLFAGAAQAAVTEFQIFKQPDFRGESHTVKGEVAHLEGGFAEDVSSIVAKGGFWEVCTGDHFKGDCHVLAAGEYPRLGALDDQIIAVRFLGTDQKHARRAEGSRDVIREARRDRHESVHHALGERHREFHREEEHRAFHEQQERRHEGRHVAGAVDLYGRPGFRGRALRVEHAIEDMWDRRFAGRASSVVVHEGRWQLCSEPGFSGRCEVVGPGRYPYLGSLDDRIASLRPVG